MSKEVKNKPYKLIDKIEDERVLNLLMEDLAFYTSKKDILDESTTDQLKELDEAIKEADKNETISWNEFKKDLHEWKQK